MPDSAVRSWLSTLPLLLALFYAPLAFGATTAETVLVLDGILTAGFLFWLISFLIRRGRARLPVVCVLVLAFLAAWGILAYLNPLSTHDAETWQFTIRQGAVDWLPGSVSPEASTPVLRHLAALLLAFLALLDFASHASTRWVLLRVVSLVGLTIAMIGIIQKASGAESMLWVTRSQSGSYFFAAFRYHGNATSFLLLSFFAALAVWLRSCATKPGGLQTSFEAVVTLLVLVGLFVNTSKGGHVFALAAILLVVIRFRRLFFTGNTSRAALVIGVLLVLSIFAIAVLPAFLTSAERWSTSTGVSAEGRLLAYQATLDAVRDAGFFGSGPGTFHIIFPFYTLELGNRIGGVWYHAHQDYLQALIEWGWLGFAAWALLIGGGLLAGLRRVVQQHRADRVEISTSCSLMAILFILVHALVDFPLQIPAIQLLFLVHLAIAWNGGNHHRRSRTRKTPA